MPTPGLYTSISIVYLRREFLLDSQHSHTSSNKAIISNLDISCQARSVSSSPLPPIDRVAYIQYPSSSAYDCVLSNGDRAIR